MTRRFFLAVVLFALLVPAPLAVADKTFTVKSVTLSHIDRLNVEVLAGVPTAVISYQLRDSTGATVGHQKTFPVALTGPQTTALVNFLTGVLPAINTAEGL